ncbi:MAG: YdeI/OmpD-associated family protein [Peptococcaceae bacterium]|nr:YdeI/OmpD-associated family protein [Peptococcaceae bacterium]
MDGVRKNPDAKKVFDGLSPSKRHEIIRYISFLKSEESVDQNVEKAINFLLGNGRFVGRDKP